ncbi:WD40-repeat-containing domain protein [Paraphysoderma sedebokerense]|nr:WD40-repeat-containing domain protein [Paraphysoderma sedebokerense]
MMLSLDKNKMTSTADTAADGTEPPRYSNKLLHPQSIQSLAHSLVLDFLRRNQYTSALEAFKKDVQSSENSFYIEAQHHLDDSSEGLGTPPQGLSDVESTHLAVRKPKRKYEPVPSLTQILDEWQSARVIEQLKDLSLSSNDDDSANDDSIVSLNRPLSQPQSYPSKLIKSFSSFMLHRLNILLAKIHYLPSSPSDPLLITTSADKSLLLTSYHSSTPVRRYSNLHSAPILSIDFHPIRKNVVLTASMDGSVCLVNLERDEFETECAIRKYKDHKKYVTAAVFSTEGDSFVSVGSDRVVNVYVHSSPSAPSETESTNSNLTSSGSNAPIYTLAYTTHLPGPVTAATYLTNNTILVACQNSYDIYFLHIPPTPSDTAASHPPSSSFILTTQNLNENNLPYVSFTPLSFSLHPAKKWLLLSTDSPSGRTILYKLLFSNLEFKLKSPFQTSTNEETVNIKTATKLAVIRNFYGKPVDQYGKTIALWSPTSSSPQSRSPLPPFYISSTSSPNVPVISVYPPSPSGTLDSSQPSIPSHESLTMYTPLSSNETSESSYYKYTTNEFVLDELNFKGIVKSMESGVIKWKDSESEQLKEKPVVVGVVWGYDETVESGIRSGLGMGRGESKVLVFGLD